MKMGTVISLIGLLVIVGLSWGDGRANNASTDTKVNLSCEAQIKENKRFESKDESLRLRVDLIEQGMAKNNAEVLGKFNLLDSKVERLETAQNEMSKELKANQKELLQAIKERSN